MCHNQDPMAYMALFSTLLIIGWWIFIINVYWPKKNNNLGYRKQIDHKKSKWDKFIYGDL